MRLDTPHDPSASPVALCSLPIPSLFSASSPEHTRAELVVADAVRRSHRAPRCHPKYPGDPPRPLLPPRREAHRGSPCIAAIAVVFYLGPAGHLRQIRRLRCLPELPEATVATPVSYSSIPPLPRARSRTLAAFSPEPIAPRRRPWRCRGQGHPSLRPSMLPSSPPSQEPAEPFRFPSSAPQRRVRPRPNSGGHLGRRRRRFRPPRPQPTPQEDAAPSQLPVEPLRRPNDRRRSDPEALRRACCRRC